ncbi:MAG: hydrogenase iron-sulfur subunit [Anaerolineae bacterium]
MAEPVKIVLIGCAHSAGESLQHLREMGRTLPEGVEWVSMPCGGAIDTLHVLRAFEHGADQVMVLACNDGACRSADGGAWAGKRVEAAREILQEVGIAPWRLAFQRIGPNMGADLLQWLAAFHEPEPSDSEPAPGTA